MRRKPIGFAQLCAVARAELTAEPTIIDSEWRERIKCRIISLGFDYPEGMPATITRAMSAVERALEKAWGPRPIDRPWGPRPPPPPASTLRDDRPLSREEARAALHAIVQRLRPSAPPVRSMPSGESELMTTRERYAVVHTIEQLRIAVALRRANQHAPRELPGERDSDAERIDEGVRADVLGATRGRGE